MVKPTSPVDLDRLAALMARRERYETQKASLNETLRLGRTRPMLDAFGREVPRTGPVPIKDDQDSD